MMITYQCDALVDKFNVTPLIIREVKDTKRPKTHKAEPCNLDGKRAVTIWFSMLKMTMPLSSSLVISFLACHQAGAPSKWESDQLRVRYFIHQSELHPSVGTSSISTVHGIEQEGNIHIQDDLPKPEKPI
ncbi:unnamed protein product [Arabidopsis thaliana]|uniref:Uncharacterized protein n=1 Tax=Arabidopsis thaliana TaxID=3702 RepID=A0A5S9WM60_ARATH|nr:unnamed protein product [Arabidopsis thaliana]